MVPVVVQVLRLQTEAAELRRQRVQRAAIVDLRVGVPRVPAVAPDVQRDLGDHQDDCGDAWEDKERRDEEQPVAGFVVAEDDFLKFFR